MPPRSSDNLVPEGWSDYADDLEIDDIWGSSVPGTSNISGAIHWVQNPKPVMCTVPGQRLYIAQSGSDFYLWKQPEDECYKIEGVKSRKVLIKAIKQTGVEGLSLKQLKSLELSICGGQEPPTPWPFNEM